MHSIPDLTAVIPARPDDSKTVFSQIIHCFLFETTVFVFISLFFVVYVQSSVYLSSPMKNNASVPGPE